MEQNTALKADQSTKMELVMPSTNQLGKLKNAETGMSLTTKYKTQEEWAEIKNKPIRCFYLGLKEIPNDKGEVVLCAGFMSDKEVFMAAQMVLVEAVKNQQIGQGVEITFLGVKPNKGEGKTNLFEVKELLGVKIDL